MKVHLKCLKDHSGSFSQQTSVSTSTNNSFIVLIISVVYSFGLILNSKQKSSNISSSKSDGKVTSTI